MLCVCQSVLLFKCCFQGVTTMSLINKILVHINLFLMIPPHIERKKSDIVCVPKSQRFYFSKHFHHFSFLQGVQKVEQFIEHLNKIKLPLWLWWSSGKIHSWQTKELYMRPKRLLGKWGRLLLQYSCMHTHIHTQPLPPPHILTIRTCSPRIRKRSLVQW